MCKVFLFSLLGFVRGASYGRDEDRSQPLVYQINERTCLSLDFWLRTLNREEITAILLNDGDDKRDTIMVSVWMLRAFL
jgi:hypothetical protein